MPMHRLIRTARSTPRLAPRAPPPPSPGPPSRFSPRPGRMPPKRLSASRRSSGQSMAKWGATSLVPAARAGNINIVMARPREDRMPCDRLTGIKAREKPPLFRAACVSAGPRCFGGGVAAFSAKICSQWDNADAVRLVAEAGHPIANLASRRLKGGRSAFCATPAPQSAWLLLRCWPGSVITV